jgi:putative ABC transport system permease protein
MAVLTVIEAGIGIMVSIFNSMSDRRHEIAVMRALGASRFTVLVVILMESILLSLMGGLVGMLLGHGAIWACSSWIADWTGVVIGIMQFQPIELILIPGLVVLASMVGFLPAMSAYRTDVAKSLITTP